MCGARVQRESHHLDVFVQGRRHNLLRGLAQACVDDLTARVAQRRRHDLGPPVVPIQAGLGDQDADGGVRAGLTALAASSIPQAGSPSPQDRGASGAGAPPLGPPSGARPLRHCPPRPTPPLLPGRQGHPRRPPRRPDGRRASTAARIRAAARARRRAVARPASSGAIARVQSASMPSWVVATVRKSSGLCPSVSRSMARPRSRQEGVRACSVCLVDDQHVSDLDQAGLHALHRIAAARRDDHHGPVSNLGDLHLALAHTDRFDEDRVVARGAPASRRRRRPRARCRPARHAWRGCGMKTPSSLVRSCMRTRISPERPAVPRRRRINRQNAHPRALCTTHARQRRNKGGLACARRSRDADTLGGPCSFQAPVREAHGAGHPRPRRPVLPT